MKTTRFILKFILLCSFVSCSDIDIDETSIEDSFIENDTVGLKAVDSRVFITNDPNLNPNWDWTSGTTQNAYATQTGLACNNCLYPILLPFFSGSHLAVPALNRDMFKEDGWVLVTRDFGVNNSNPAKGFPFFILYNKYRGLLRLNYYNAFSYAYTQHLVTLKFQNPSSSGRIFALASTDIAKSTTDTSSGLESSSSVQRVQALAGWGVVDFYLGYDPNLNPNSILQFDISGVNETVTTGTGNISLAGEAKITKVGSPSVIDLFKNTGSFLDKLNKILKTKPSDINFTTYTTGISGLSSGLGIVKFFIGGKKKETQSIPINLNGTFNWSSISSRQPLQSIKLNVRTNSWINDGSSYKPLNAVNFGLLNIRTKPKVYATSSTIRESSEQYQEECEYYHRVSYSTRTDQRSFIDLDPASGCTITSIQVASPKDVKNNFYSSSSGYVDIGKEFTSTAFSNGSKSPSLTGLFNKREISLRINIKTNSATRNMDNEYVIYKTVPFDLVLGNQTYSDQCN